MPKKGSKKKKPIQQPSPHASKTPHHIAEQKTQQPTASAIRLFTRTIRTLLQHKKIFAGVLACIGLVQLIVVEGVVRTDFVAINKQMQELVGGGAHGLGSGALSYAYLLSSSGQANGTGVIQLLMSVITILALLWLTREFAAGNTPRIRDAFYKSMYPLVPFILVLLWLGLQLVPAMIGIWFYSAVTTNGIAVHVYEQLLWLAGAIGLSILSIRWSIGTIFALIAVTLPDMAPMTAIRSTRQIVHGKRLRIFSKLLFLGVMQLLALTVILLPAIIIVPVIVPFLFYIMSLIILAVTTVYTYTLYKELLK